MGEEYGYDFVKHVGYRAVTYEIRYHDPARKISGKVLVGDMRSLTAELHDIDSKGSVLLGVTPAEWDVAPGDTHAGRD